MNRALLFLATTLLATTAAAQSGVTASEPYVGQPGKDVIWVPTPPTLVEKMLDMATVTPKDFVIDLGSGDGRIVIEAAKRGARALGVEYDQNLVQVSRTCRDCRRSGSRQCKATCSRPTFPATVLALFLLPTTRNG
jgi:hypothetical protein